MLLAWTSFRPSGRFSRRCSYTCTAMELSRHSYTPLDFVNLLRSSHNHTRCFAPEVIKTNYSVSRGWRPASKSRAQSNNSEINVKRIFMRACSRILLAVHSQSRQYFRCKQKISRVNSSGINCSDWYIFSHIVQSDLISCR